jgi:UPF0271 protein
MNTSFILDTSAILSGILAKQLEGNVWITEEVLSEIKQFELNMLVNTYIETGILNIGHPSISSIHKVINVAIKLGEISVLSKADISILALGIDLSLQGENVIILTNDYSIQNVALELGIKYKPIGKQKISRKITWLYYCQDCGYSARVITNSCPKCGSKNIKRTVVRHSKII